MELSRKPMRKSRIITIIFIVICLLLTFFSKTLYNINIPVVHYTSPSRGYLSISFTNRAQITPKKLYKLYAGSMVKTTAVYAEEGAEVKAGDVLAEFDTRELEMQLQDIKDERLTLVEQKRQMGSSKSLNRQIASLERKIAYQEEQLENAAQIVAPVDGFVQSVSIEAGTTAQQIEPAIVVADNSEGFEATVSVPSDRAVWFETGGSVDASILSMSNRAVKGKITSKKQIDNETTEITVTITDDTNMLRSEEVVELNFEKVTQQYDCKIPVEALWESADDGTGLSLYESYYVYTLEERSGALGKEYYINRVKVKVLERDEQEAAVEGSLDSHTTIITSSSKRELEVGGRARKYNES